MPTKAKLEKISSWHIMLPGKGLHHPDHRQPEEYL
jgi:hypothetical protein